MRYAVIEKGKVINVIEAKSGFEIEGKKLVQSNFANINWDYDGEEFIKPAPRKKTFKEKRIEKYVDKGWIRPFDLIGDILDRGIDAVKTDRDAIKAAYPEV